MTIEMSQLFQIRYYYIRNFNFPWQNPKDFRYSNDFNAGIDLERISEIINRHSLLFQSVYVIQLQ